MNDPGLNKPLVEKLAKDFALVPSSTMIEEGMPEIKRRLTQRVAELMDKDYDRFLLSLYRMDINEEKVMHVLNTSNVLDLPANIADLIIERQIQRINTQRLYKEGKL